MGSNFSERPVFLDFDSTVSNGSREHYFHFLWGYLLPALHWLTEKPRGTPAQVRLLTCGPSMDPVMEEACRLIGIEPVILPSPPHDGPRLTLPRWDEILVRQAALVGPASGLRARLGYLRLFWRGAHPVSLRALPRPGELRRLRKRALAVRARLIEGVRAAGAPDPALVDRILVLRRSAMPAYYAPGGGAEIKGYGTGRRALEGIDEAVEDLDRRGVPVAVFEPGSAGLAAQIRAFSGAAGVVGVRGAEFANLIWMEPGRRALMLTPSDKVFSPVPMTQMVAMLAGVDLAEERVRDGAVATVHADAVARFFGGQFGTGTEIVREVGIPAHP